MLNKLKSIFGRPNNRSESSPTQSSKPQSELFTLDKSLIVTLEKMAEKEDRSAVELAHDLLDEGIRRRNSADAWLEMWHKLTPREKLAAGLTCLGYTNDEIAQQMTISPNTVKTYVKNILTKFKVNSKTELRNLLSDWDFSEWVEGSLKK